MLRAIIIDDEEHQRLNIEKMIKLYCPDIIVVDKAEGVLSGVEAIHNNNPDLVFLDIELSDGTGFELLESIKKISFKVIFITAFDQYAIRAFRFNALDYLLKPIDPEELCQATSRAVEVFQDDFNKQLENLRSFLHGNKTNHTKIIIKTFDCIHLVPIQNILYCESDSNYTRFHLLDDKKILVSTTLKEYEDILNESGFFRVHKSYLVNMQHVSRFEKADGGSVILENDIKIPVASRKRDKLVEMLVSITKQK